MIWRTCLKFTWEHVNIMSEVARILQMFASRLDAVHLKVIRLEENSTQTSAQTSAQNTTQKQAPAMDTAATPLGGEVEELKANVSKVQSALRDMKDAQTSAFKKERSVTEAVLTQKLERMVGEKSAQPAQKVEDVQESVKKLADRVSAITLAVDKQAKFLTELNAHIVQSINKAVERSVAEAISKVGGNASKAEPPGDMTDALDELEDGPDLEKADQGPEDKDQITMTPAGGEPAKKGKAKSRGKASKSAKDADAGTEAAAS